MKTLANVVFVVYTTSADRRTLGDECMEGNGCNSVRDN